MSFILLGIPLLAGIVGYVLVKPKVKKQWIAVVIALGIGCGGFVVAASLLAIALQSMD